MTLFSRPNDPDCLFCKIHAGILPCAKVYEDDHIFAFLDINPVSVGHALVITKGHWANLLEIPEGVGESLFRGLRLVADALMKETKADGFNCVQNNNAAAGQVIFHAHWHLIPRYSEDGLAHWPGSPCKDPEALQKLAASIRNCF